MALCQTSVLKVYHAVMEDVISNVRDAFLDDGVDEQVLQEMKQIWRNKLMSSKAVEINPEQSEPQPPQIIVNNPKASAAKAKRQAAIAAAAQHNNSSAIATTNSATTNLDIKPGIAGNAGSTGGATVGLTNSSGNSISAQQQTSATGPLPIVAALDPCRIMPVNITLPAQPGTHNTEPRVLTIHVPASALQENQLTQILTAQLISSIISLPTTLANSVLQQHVTAALQNLSIQKFNPSKQLDGQLVDTTDEEESDVSDDNIDEDDEDIDKDEDEDIENEDGAEEEPLNSGDDVSDEDSTDLFDTDNVIVCQYDKITRSRNKWKFYLKDGIMNIAGKDYVFQKSNGDAEWVHFVTQTNSPISKFSRLD
ncbi:transcription initiation factor IIA subunit 1-like isoform X2 [Teleopsis dalmanni]|uniref:transcription initiation factor IIA subunit 1-like isoform X2 n=1 Tax=Teleopsis dalmanni TaxID=139649 RepID=UPI0018CD3EFE|nr:transcription initiation factor IIA subunit 1-like isoform X2 [Teleopsis dalmanni]XP_037951265.1 transcription initiation factor IIA subunit 1-like isoform X2 [Teleopsis dalmanni]